MNEEQMFDEMLIMAGVCSAIIFHLDAIQESSDKGDIKTHIACIEEIESTAPLSFRMNRCLKTAIREGNGDFKKIQEKCVSLGVV